METIVFSFANQKGGVGKSSLLTFIANYIHNYTNYSIGCIDCDFQRSLTEWRNLDLQEDNVDEEALYDIYSIDPEQVEDYYDSLYGEYDFIAIDNPGNIRQEGVLDSYKYVDIMFIPFNITTADVSSTQSFIENFKAVDDIRKQADLPEVQKLGVLSKIDKRTAEGRNFKEFQDEFGIHCLDTPYYHRPKYAQSTNTSIYKKMDPEIKKLAEEVFGILENLYVSRNKMVEQ